MAALISSYTLALAGAALIIAWLQTQPPHPPPHASAAAATNIVLWSEP